jgi:hypothetical protein
MNNYWKAIVCLSILSLGLIAYIYFREIGPGPGAVDVVKPLRDSIALIEKQRLELESKISTQNRAYDSLVALKQKSYPVYYEKIKFLSGASPAECDSVIRKLAGL